MKRHSSGIADLLGNESDGTIVASFGSLPHSSRGSFGGAQAAGAATLSSTSQSRSKSPTLQQKLRPSWESSALRTQALDIERYRILSSRETPLPLQVRMQSSRSSSF